MVSQGFPIELGDSPLPGGHLPEGIQFRSIKPGCMENIQHLQWEFTVPIETGVTCGFQISLPESMFHF